MSAENTPAKPYPEVDPRPSFPAIERGILARWAEDGTFQKSVDQRPAGEDGANDLGADTGGIATGHGNR